MPPIQVPSLLVPSNFVRVTDVQVVATADVVNSTEILVENLKEKTAYIWAMEMVVFGAAGQLWAWVELSPCASSVSGAFWAAINGGAGPSYPLVPTLPPNLPLTLNGGGVNTVVQTAMLRWQNHSTYARIRLQTPTVGVGGSFWAVQVWVEGKG